MQDDLYDMAETGVNNLTDDEDYGNVLSSLVMCQQAVNAPSLILDEEGKPFEGPSSKVDTLIDLLLEDAVDQKVIVFSRFEKMISVIEERFKKEKINYVRITGKENNSKYRQEAREKFQDLNSGINVILITMAGSESLNLQAAEHFVFVDLPWSFGDYTQLIGRMIRIGSAHKTVVAHHFLGKRTDGSNTIDHHVLKALQSKKKLSDKVSGESIQGGLQLSSQDSVHDILDYMKSGGAKPEKKSVKKTNKPRPSKTVNSETSSIKVQEKPEDWIKTLVLDLSDI
jgi:SNF2 family DNA or RNA helicase